jgi:hypothetical protein
MMSSRNPRLEPRTIEGEALRRRQPDGVQVIREACLTLNATAPTVIRSMTVFVGLDDLPVGPSAAIDFAERIAAEFGLAAQAHLSRYRLVARIYRPDPTLEETERLAVVGGISFKAIARWLGIAQNAHPDDASATTRSREEAE